MHLGAKIDLQSWGAFQSTFNFAPVEIYSISCCNWLSLLKIPIPSATFKPQISPNIQFPVAQDITIAMSPWQLHRLLGVDISYVWQWSQGDLGADTVGAWDKVHQINEINEIHELRTLLKETSCVKCKCSTMIASFVWCLDFIVNPYDGKLLWRGLDLRHGVVKT